ncbi:MAG: nuclear transport factor 2 family protein [Parvularcula sp.]|jgi:hypothetical protein|nr:nuclear transport factor 2 family protein [Parvularcula sp.]
MRRLIFSALLVCLPVAAQAADPTSEAIEAAVFDYFEGQGERSEERLNRAFLAETAMMVGITKGENGTEVSSTPIKEVIPAWSRGEPTTQDRQGRIIAMNVTDDRLATVLFDSDGRFYDALTLAKIDGDWKIVSKVYVRQNED